MLLIYFIWKYYTELAKNYNIEKVWPFILLGVVVYYAGNFLGGIIIGLAAIALDINIEETSDVVINLMALPMGILCSYLLYKYLEKKWKTQYVNPELALNEIGSEAPDEQPLIR